MLIEHNIAYLQQHEIWRQIRAALKGKYAVVDIVDCLPSPQYKDHFYYNGMSDAARRAADRCNAVNSQRKKSYWARGRFFNATARTHDSLDGMVWSKPPEKELPARLQYLEDQADSNGNGLREVAQEITDELISIGRYGVLVDMPQNETRLTANQQENAAFAPKFVTYQAEQIKYFRCSSNGSSVDEIHLSETQDVQKSEFVWETVEYTRRLVIKDGVYINELYDEKDQLISQVIPRANGRNLSYIPFQFFGSDNNSPDYSKAPLYDLTNINLGHFVLDCDNRDNLHYHGQGMTVVTTSMDADEFNEANPSGLDVGAKGMNQLQQGDDVKIIQIEATGALPSEMLRDEQRMIYLGAQLVQDSSSTQTLGAKEMEFSASTSTLKRIANNATDGIEQCIRWAGEFLGVAEEVKYKLNTKFVTDSMDAPKIAQHFQAVQSGLLPRETYYDTARAAGFTELDNEDIEALALDDNMMGQGMSEEAARQQAQLDAQNAE